MAKGKKRKTPIVNKEYIWDLEVEGELHQYKVFVGEDECITYEDGVECKHLKIMDKTQQEGLLQIDCKTKVFDDSQVPFQLENGIPYIKILDDEDNLRWTSSDTTKEDRLQDQVRNVKLRAYLMIGLAVVSGLIGVIQYRVKGTLGEYPVSPMMAALCVCAAIMNFAQLRNELIAMGRKFSFNPNVKA